MDFHASIGEALNAALNAFIRCGVVLAFLCFAGWVSWAFFTNDSLKNRDENKKDFHEDDY